MYSPSQISPLHRDDSEKINAHPVYEAFMNTEVSKTFSKKEVRETVIPGYMGLIKQIDDNLGRLFKFLEKNGKMDDTMIVFTSDHGDYLGDHWLGEKEFFHEQCVKVPLIIYDPSESTNKTRGTRNNRLVEAIDLLPTFLDATENTSSQHRLEGKSLLPMLQGKNQKNWRNAVFSEIDYAFYHQREFLNLGPHDARAYMIRTYKWKYVYFKGFLPQLFDLTKDPAEFHDLGQLSEYKEVRNELKDILLQRLINRKNLVTFNEERILKQRDDSSEGGVMIGVW
jgi:arylsulfatase A-like enzyme